AAHESKCRDGFPDTSNYDGLPGIAGGLPLGFINIFSIKFDSGSDICHADRGDFAASASASSFSVSGNFSQSETRAIAAAARRSSPALRC
ncbi:hypothetical protein, partial [Novosphingobium sp. CF614]|uniref:hypothetical protein n=1 Tax=Novosphingobium sp. CF614 TaxID=1884364 RepID=UPI001C431E07